jgi:hypothetical protein
MGFKTFCLIASVSAALAPSLIIAGDSESKPARAGLDWWAFQTVERPAVPEIGETSHPIDAFVGARLQVANMQPAPAADPKKLIRRAYYDLIGLPPAFEEIEAIAADLSPDAYEKLIDRLMKSDHFGERWARHWLDVVRFAETNGYERDAVKPNIWKYRDWVIEAFNDDMPYDRFVREQLAGDEIPGRTEQSVIATGMLRAGTWNDEPNDPQDYKYERLEDMVHAASTAFLGVTVKCARCHDHKFDPIPQRDYYRFASAFWPGADGKHMGGPTEEELGVKAVFGWTDLKREPSPFHLLEKGDPHLIGEVVEPGVLSLAPVLDKPFAPPPKESKTSHRRLQLASFIADRRNPLTARVMVNRLWQQLFGKGIVRTPNNFGFKADPPTHPKLLDWLAAEFMDGGWKVKRMLRLIMTSQTYRQASVHSLETAYARKDSGNRLLWKMNRRRADAEFLRDAMLRATGELNTRMGGASFYPRMAPEVLEGFSRKSSAWTESPSEERRRRSVYMMTKRHLLLPLMTTFDFPSSEKPCGKRNVTTVAPQALALLNNHFVHERSESLAQQAVRKNLPVEERFGYVWKAVLGREPIESEIAQARGHYTQQRAYFEEQREARENAPESQKPEPHVSEEALKRQITDPDVLALASLCHVLLNTNEFLYVD